MFDEQGSIEREDKDMLGLTISQSDLKAGAKRLDAFDEKLRELRTELEGRSFSVIATDLIQGIFEHAEFHSAQLRKRLLAAEPEK